MLKRLAKIPIGFYLVLFVLLAFLQVWLTRDTVMGDAFIHFTFARGIAEGTPFFYNGEFSAGSTSPLWSLLLAPLWLLLGDGIVWGVKILAGIFVGTSVVLTYLLAQKITSNKNLSLVASFLIATNFFLSWWAAKGMETPLYVSLVLTNFLVYLHVPRDISRDNGGYKLELTLGILLGLTILTRPEGWFLAAFLGIFLLTKKGWRVVATVGLPALAIVAPYYLYLYQQTGQVFPSSMARILHARQWAIETVGIWWTPEILKILATKYLPLTPFFLILIWHVGARKINNLDASNAPVWLWLIFHLIFFTFVMPTSQGERYILAAVPFFIIFSLLSLWNIPPLKKGGRGGVFTILLTLVLISSTVISAQQLVERRQIITSCERPYIDTVRRETGLWLRNNTEINDLIAVKEVDQSAYYSERRVLSMDGTLNTKAVPFVRQADQLGFIEKYRPDWLVLEEDMYRLYPDWQTSNLAELIDHDLIIGESRQLDNVEFTLAHKMDVGDEKTCPHFKDQYYWYIFQLNYL